MRKEKVKPARLVRKPHKGRGRLAMMVLSIVLLLGVAIGGTIAWLSTKTTSVTNTFTPAKVTCEVTEDFNEDTGVKTNVNVKNAGNIAVYIRVKLVTYRTNDARQHIGGTAELSKFTPGENWVEYGKYYYYTLPVAPGGKPAANLADSMTLEKSYKDADGGKQALDVMAEAIQSEPKKAVGEAWGVTITRNSVTPYKTGN
ncbi:MAG: hypothetical protein Q4G01_03530 [Eubacteriales bacterium]|nr:hypothetical protein [Eubacteriales bacterium]